MRGPLAERGRHHSDTRRAPPPKPIPSSVTSRRGPRLWSSMAYGAIATTGTMILATAAKKPPGSPAELVVLSRSPTSTHSAVVVSPDRPPSE